MKTVLISDIHGAHEALQRVLAHHPQDTVICLGDAVGKHHNDETLRLLKDRGVPCVNGNHEVDIMHLYQVSNVWRGWVRSWPDRLVDGDVLYCHTRVDQNRRFHQIDSIFAAKEMFLSADFRAAFVGHSHSPGWWWWPSEDERPVWTHAQPDTKLDMGEGRYIVDVGSVGEPKGDVDPRYVVSDGQVVTWKGLP